MGEPTASDVLHIWAAVAFLILLPWTIGQLPRIRRTPAADGPITRYLTRAALRVVVALLLSSGLALIWFGIDRVLDDDAIIGITALTFGSFLDVFGLAIANQTEVTLDRNGVRSRQVFGRNRAISWIDLQHVETRINARTAGGTIYYLRGSTGTTIVLTDLAFDATDLLGRIRQRRALAEVPYQRRHWYGG
jgi:hypothetical protein